jgi:hypothetical protein
VLGTQTFYHVFPTGSVSATSSETATEQYTGFLGNEYITIDVTVTRIYLASGSAAACTFSPCKSTRTDSSEDIDTTVFAPVVVTNAASCTQTSYRYTTSSSGTLSPVMLNSMPGVLDQATDTGAAGPALAVTTYVVTVSTNLGGQAVTTRRCDVFLKPDQARGLTVGRDESDLVTECVDPRHYLCPSAKTTLGRPASPTCGTDWIAAYGQGQQTAATGGGQETSPTNGAPTPNGARGRHGMASRWVMLGAGLLSLCFMA